jgi:hypothetical protein
VNLRQWHVQVNVHINVKFCTVYDGAIFDWVFPFELWKNPLIFSFRSFSLHWLHILKWKFAYRFIIRIYISSSVFFYFRTIFDTVLVLGLRKITWICNFRPFSLHWLNILKWNLGIQIYHKYSYIKFSFGYDLAFLTELSPLDSDNSNYLQLLFSFFDLVAHIEMKFSIQICHKNIYVIFSFGYNHTIIDRVMALGLRQIQTICGLYPCP